jgi:quinol monooxygenase YgiN
VIVLVSRIVVRADAVTDVAKAVRAMTDPSRAEEGCLLYLGHQSADDERTFLFYEQWADEAALDAHRAMPHFRELVDGVIAPAIESRQRDFYRIIE